MSSSHKLVLIFRSSHEVMKAERILREKMFKCEIIPTPKEISSECGMSIRIDEDICNRAEKLIKSYRINFEIY